MNVDVCRASTNIAPVVPDGAPRILIVDDDLAVATLVTYNLESKGYSTYHAYTAEDAMRMITESVPDLVILDWMLPKAPGIEILRQIRARPESERVPVIMMSARHEETDKVIALGAGADDYIVKPFSIAELVQRAENMLVRARKPGKRMDTDSGNFLQVGDIIADIGGHRVTRAGKEIRLYPVGFDLLTRLMTRPGHVFTRDALGGKYELDRAIDQNICRVSRSLNAGGKANPIITMRGSGYTFDKDYKS